MQGIEAGLSRTVQQVTGLHYVNAPNHAIETLRVVLGIVRSVEMSASDDPLLFAYQLQDVLPELASHIITLEKWAVAVVDATPDQIPSKGAR